MDTETPAPKPRKKPAPVLLIISIHVSGMPKDAYKFARQLGEVAETLFVAETQRHGHPMTLECNLSKWERME